MTEKHAKFPPSAGHRWIQCPGSITLAGHIVEGEPSSYAWEGTVCHEIAAYCLKNNAPANKNLGNDVEGVLITQELVDAIQMYVDEVRSTAVEMKVKGGLIEYQVELTPDCWGTADAVLWNDEVLCITDAKFGKGVIVEAENNPQLRIYAIGILKKLKEDGIPMPKRILMKIVQPRTVNPVREFSETIEELQTWAKDVLAPALSRLRDGDTTCVPSEGACRWCPISTDCTVQADMILKQAAQAFEPFTQLESPEKEIAPSGDLMNLEAKAKLALSFKHIENWMKEIREHLTAIALAGEEVPYFKLVEGRSVRKWGVEETKTVAFLKGHDINPYEERLKTPPAVEKEVGKKKAKEIDLESIIIKPAGTPTLVPESDKRPALEPNVEKQFEGFADEIATSSSPIVVVESEAAEEEMSLMQRLKRGEDTGPAEPEETMVEEDNGIEEKAGVVGEPAPPNAPKRRQVLEAILKESHTLKTLSDQLGTTENSIRMHLRYLHERDGFGFVLYKDGQVEIIS